jgi:carboxyl-terminal processing protease
VSRPGLSKVAPLVALLAVAALAAFGPGRRRSAGASVDLLQDVMSLVRDRYVDTLGDSALFARAARGVVAQLGDPYSVLYSPRELEAFEAGTEGHYAGVGMLIEDQEGRHVVSRVYPNTPAERGGVVAGDQVITVNGRPVRGWPLEQLTDSLRGPAGTRVSVSFARAGAAPVIADFARERVRIPAVPFATLLPGGVGYLPLQQFNETSGAETRRLADSLVRAGARSLVLDLRDDGGGIVDQAVDVASLFLPRGALVARVSGRGADLGRYVTQSDPALPQLPLVVLVDGGTASASEIVAGALQDHDRALVVGERTFGKGLVQGLWRLEGGWALKMTTGRWMTPSGRSLHRARSEADSLVLAAADTMAVHRSNGGRALRGGGGVAPDVPVSPDSLTSAERALAAALGPQTRTAYRALYGYALELKGSADSSLAVRREWREELLRRWTDAGVAVPRATFDSAQATVDHMLAARVGRFAFGEAQVLRRYWREDAVLARAVTLLGAARTTPELIALGARETRLTSTPPAGKPKG